MSPLRLGDLLVTRGVLEPGQVEAVLDAQRETGRPFGELAERLFGVAPAEIEAAWTAQFADEDAAWLDPLAEPVEPDVLRIVDRRQAWQFGLLPLRREWGGVRIVTSRSNLVRVTRFIASHLGEPAFLFLAETDRLERALQRWYPLPGARLHPERGLELADRSAESGAAPPSPPDAPEARAG